MKRPPIQPGTFAIVTRSGTGRVRRLNDRPATRPRASVASDLARPVYPVLHAQPRKKNQPRMHTNRNSYLCAFVSTRGCFFFVR